MVKPKDTTADTNDDVTTKTLTVHMKHNTFNFPQLLLHFFHFLEGSSNTAYSAKKEMESTDESYLSTRTDIEKTISWERLGWRRCEGCPNSHAHWLRITTRGCGLCSTRQRHCIGTAQAWTGGAIRVQSRVDGKCKDASRMGAESRWWEGIFLGLVAVGQGASFS